MFPIFRDGLDIETGSRKAAETLQQTDINGTETGSS